jgi:DNA repair exonuclease SbcCD ATPase subunit
MARRQAIAADELFETANRLKAEGKEVTALTLLDALGGGSLSTIYKHLEVWHASKPAEVITPGEELPPQVLASFTASWRLATQEAGRQVAEVREKAKEETAAALRQFHGALEAIAKLEAESEADAQEIERLTGKIAEVENALHELQKEAAGQKSLVEQLQKLTEKQEKVIEGLREESAKASELKGTVSTLQAQNDKLMQRLSEQKTK